MKRFFLSAFFACACIALYAQNLQLHYDFGHLMYEDLKQDKESGTGWPSFTSTVEMFRPDTLGSLYFFVDFDYSFQKAYGAYWEISHEFCFWKKSKANWLSIHAEYNGGLNRVVGGYNDAWLLGLTYSGHSKDYSKTWSLSAMYKLIPHTIGLNGQKDVHNFQLTGVWNIDFAKGWCTFSGFIDFWREPRAWQGTEYILLSEPQFWFNFWNIRGWDQVKLSLGTEWRISNNFVDAGFYFLPTIAVKWDFSR